MKRLLVALAAAGALFPASAHASDVARNGSASASSTERSSAEFVPARANDGASLTRWSSAHQDNQWWQVDLGSVKTINRVELNWEAAYASQYRIQTRTSSTNSWSTAVTASIGSPGLKVHTFAAGSARYVRVRGDVRATAWGISLSTRARLRRKQLHDLGTRILLRRPVQGALLRQRDPLGPRGIGAVRAGTGHRP